MTYGLLLDRTEDKEKEKGMGSCGSNVWGVGDRVAAFAMTPTILPSSDWPHIFEIRKRTPEFRDFFHCAIQLKRYLDNTLSMAPIARELSQDELGRRKVIDPLHDFCAC